MGVVNSYTFPPSPRRASNCHAPRRYLLVCVLVYNELLAPYGQHGVYNALLTVCLETGHTTAQTNTGQFEKRLNYARGVVNQLKLGLAGLQDQPSTVILGRGQVGVVTWVWSSGCGQTGVVKSMWLVLMIELSWKYDI